jgi:acyl-coenzyme A thioesterase PaaI-like protein
MRRPLGRPDAAHGSRRKGLAPLHEQRVIAKDPAYETRVRESFSRQTHMTTLGVKIVFIAPGELHLALPFAPQFCQQNGFLHAGAIASVADSANGYAAYTLAPPDTDVLAVEFKINLLAPARGEGPCPNP